MTTFLYLVVVDAASSDEADMAMFSRFGLRGQGGGINWHPWPGTAETVLRLREALARCRDGVSDTQDCLADLMAAAESVLGGH